MFKTNSQNNNLINLLLKDTNLMAKFGLFKRNFDLRRPFEQSLLFDVLSQCSNFFLRDPSLNIFFRTKILIIFLIIFLLFSFIIYSEKIVFKNLQLTILMKIF